MNTGQSVITSNGLTVRPEEQMNKSKNELILVG